MIRRLIILFSFVLLSGAAHAQVPATSSVCTTSVQLPPPAPARGGAAAGAEAGRRGQQGQAAPTPASAELPRLIRVKDDVYVIQNVNNTVAEIGQFGGNVTIYMTDDGVILFDSKNDQMHDDIVAKVGRLPTNPSSTWC